MLMVEALLMVQKCYFSPQIAVKAIAVLLKIEEICLFQEM